MEKRYLVKSVVYMDYSRNSICVEIVTQSKLEQLRKLIEGEFSYYEYNKAGKHSESHVFIDEDDFVVLSEDINDINYFERLFGQYLGNVHYSDYVLEKAYDQGFFDDCVEEE
ncbi:hypothetical protein M5X00_25930 [Paenibacillus alvei]|uniref:hypothetical protein n=1 Tax=Paenibacillus alvei TaxID=44250 RepID=UPI002281C6BA|nr:hypothetical protein [Paenibacillus alvei]MCY9757670.1 hypothetical protein [Paenibacillus alvei]